MSSRLKVFFDGGCRPNPGAMELAVVAGGHVHVLRDLGHGTSADAEWLALIEAFRIALSLGKPEFVLLGDAISVVRVAGGTAKCPASAVHHLDAFRSLLPIGGTPPIRYVKRSQNLAGIALARLHPR